MEKSEKPYKPVSCTFMDVVEATATRHRNNPNALAKIMVRMNSAEPQLLEGRIVNWVNREGAEYMVLDDGLEVRMDFVLSIDGVLAGKE